MGWSISIPVYAAGVVTTSAVSIVEASADSDTYTDIAFPDGTQKTVRIRDLTKAVSAMRKFTTV